MGELVSHKYGRHFSRDSVFSAINLFGSTLFLDICMHQQHFVQRIFYHLYLVLPPAPNAHGGNDRTRGAVCGARSRRPAVPRAPPTWLQRLGLDPIVASSPSPDRHTALAPPQLARRGGSSPQQFSRVVLEG